MLVRTRPDVVIETGTAFGGSALFLASVFEHIGHGEVITIDIEPNPSRPQHPRISYLLGSSVDPAIIAKVRARVDGKRAMVVLDSDHRADHVHAEMVAYAPTVQGSDYLIVEDTNINGHPTYAGFGPGPMEAVDRFLAGTGDFEVDERCQRFMMTLNPRDSCRGWRQRSGSGTPGPRWEESTPGRGDIDDRRSLASDPCPPPSQPFSCCPHWPPFGAVFVSGGFAMLAEGFQSLVDTGFRLSRVRGTKNSRPQSMVRYPLGQRQEVRSSGRDA